MQSIKKVTRQQAKPMVDLTTANQKEHTTDGEKHRYQPKKSVRLKSNLQPQGQRFGYQKAPIPK